MFNTMVKPKGQPEETSKEGLSVEEKVMIRAQRKISPNKEGGKTGGKQGKPTSQNGRPTGPGFIKKEKMRRR